MRRWIATISIGGLAAAAFVGPGSAAAHGGEYATCTDVEFLGVEVHGDHVVRDYVKGVDGEVGHGEGAAIPGGPGPGFHFPNDVAPGASFCNPQSNSPGFHVS